MNNARSGSKNSAKDNVRNDNKNFGTILTNDDDKVKGREGMGGNKPSQNNYENSKGEIKRDEIKKEEIKKDENKEIEYVIGTGFDNDYVDTHKPFNGKDKNSETNKKDDKFEDRFEENYNGGKPVNPNNKYGHNDFNSKEKYENDYYKNDNKHDNKHESYENHGSKEHGEYKNWDDKFEDMKHDNYEHDYYKHDDKFEPSKHDNNKHGKYGENHEYHEYDKHEENEKYDKHEKHEEYKGQNECHEWTCEDVLCDTEFDCECDPISEALADIVESIAHQENGIAKILDSESKKICRAISMAECVDDLLKVNKSVQDTIKQINNVQIVLISKLQEVSDICDGCYDDDCGRN